MKNKELIDFAVGGQAVLEGVMMRSPHFFTVSVRDPEGNIQSKQMKFRSITGRFPILNVPLIRGVIHLVESMVIGIRSLNYSNAIFLGEVESEEVEARWKTVLWSILGGLYFAGSLALTLFMLKVMPLWIAEQASQIWPIIKEQYFLYNLVDGITKISIFMGYIAAISLIKDIKRVFQYHGAEHKSIWTYERGLPLTVENARKQTRFHPRCGTSFIVLVVFISIIVYMFLPQAASFQMKLLERVLVLPLIAGLSYEILKFTGKYQSHTFVKWISIPGLFIQKLTTREPDDAQLEIALHSLKASLQVEQTLVP